MTYLHAVILGIVEGISEFLPISSTGHLVLAGRLLHLTQTEFLKTFDIAIQSGAIMAVLTLYGKSFLRSWELVKRVLVAFVPTGVLGLLLYRTVKQLLGSPWVVIIALGIGGIFLILFERFFDESPEAHENLAVMPYRTAFLIGLSQSLAIIPGVSRAAATICGGLALGLSRRAVVEFSFLLALPTLAAATGLDLLKTADSFSSHDAGLLAVGFVVSWFVAVVSIRWLLRVVRDTDFTAFGIYRIVASVLFGLLILH